MSPVRHITSSIHPEPSTRSRSSARKAANRDANAIRLICEACCVSRRDTVPSEFTPDSNIAITPSAGC